MNKRLKKYDYGDYYSKQGSFGPEGSIGQAASPYYNNSNLNSLSVTNRGQGNTNPNIGNFARGISNFNQNGGRDLIATAATAIGDASPGKDLEQTDYTGQLQRTRQFGRTVQTAATAINPLVGAGIAIGSGIGRHTVDEFGQYKSRAGNAIDEMVNPITGLQGINTIFKGQQTVSGGINKLTLGLFGKSDNQQKAEKGRQEYEMRRIAAIRNRSQQTLAAFPTEGYSTAFAKGGRFPLGGQLPSPTEGGEENQLASNISQYNGNTHANGGIPLDTNNDGSPNIEVEDKEVVKDDMVLSNRLKPSKEVRESAKRLGLNIKNRETYASLAARLGKKKGDFEEHLDSTIPGRANTAKLMSNRIDATIDMLFMDQQVRKFPSTGKKYPDGGVIPSSKSLISGPIYAPQDPRTSLDQNRIRAVNNANLAQRYKNIVTPNNLVPSSEYAQLIGNSNFNGFQQQVGGGARNYASVDPMSLQRADSVIQAGRPFLIQQNAGLATRKYGGYLPKAANGRKLPVLSDRWIDNPLSGSSTRLKTGATDTTKQEILQTNSNPYTPTPRNFDISDYKTDIAAGIGTLANQLLINKVETQYNPETIDAPTNFYNDRTGNIINQVNQQFRNASQGIQGSSVGDNQALKANLYAKSLSSLNEALDSETQRKDAINSRYSELVNRTNTINANIKNQGKFVSMENKNKKLALIQNNVDNLVHSYIGNEFTRDQKSLEFNRNYMSAAASGDRGVAERYLKSLPKKTRRQIGYE